MLQRRMRWLLTVSLGLLAGQAFGQAPASGASGVEPKADEILQRMSKCLAGAKQFSFQAQDMVDEILDSGQKVQFSSTRRLAVRRPNRASAEITGDVLHERIRYDGETLTVLDHKQNVYGVLKVPDNIDEMLDYVAEYFGVIMPLADLLFSDPYETFTHNVWLGRYVGLHQVLGVKCHHLAFQQEGLDWQIWIEDSDQPLPRKLVITYKAFPGQPQYITFLGEWNLSAQLPDSAFTLEIPEGLEKIELKRIREGREGAGTGRMPVDEPAAEEGPGN